MERTSEAKKKIIYYKFMVMKLTSTPTNARIICNPIFKVQRENNYQTRILLPAKLSFQIKGKMKSNNSNYDQGFQGNNIKDIGSSSCHCAQETV